MGEKADTDAVTAECTYIQGAALRATSESDAGLAVWDGVLNDVQAQFILDTGASRCFLLTTEAERTGVSITQGPAVRVKHSSGETELSTSYAMGAVLQFGAGWAARVDFLLLNKMPAVGMVLGLDFHRRYKLKADYSKTPLEVEMTLGIKRITVSPGINTAWTDAESSKLQRLHSMKDIGDEDEVFIVYMCARAADDDDEKRANEKGIHRVDLEGDDGEHAAFAFLSASKTTAPTTHADSVEHAQQVSEALNVNEALKNMRREEEADSTPEQKDRLEAMLVEYGEVFDDPDIAAAEAKRDSKLGVHKIELKPNVPLPPVQRRDIHSPEKVDAMREQIKMLLRRGFIEPSSSEVGSPVMLVRKPTGAWRFTIDYRAINRVTKGDAYLPPRPDALVPRVRGAEVFAKFDAKDGFWQIPMDPGSKYLTAFTTSCGSYQWTVLPQGLKQAPARFQRFIDDALKACSDFCIIYVDDIIIWAADNDELLERVRQLLEECKKNNIKLKREKCAFFLKTVRFLGNILSGESISADAEKVEALHKLSTPRCVKDVQALLGNVGFLRPFMPDITTKLAPLHALLHKGTRFTWTEEHETAKKIIVDALLDGHVLALSNPTRRKALMTDASNFAMGAVLLQSTAALEKMIADSGSDDVGQHGLTNGVDGVDGVPLWRPVAYWSKAFSTMQARQAATSREFLAMAEAAIHWSHEFAHQPSRTVSVFSDHKPLEALGKASRLNGLMLRRLDELQAMDFRVQYLHPSLLGPADWLSRQPDHRQALAAELLRRETEGETHPWLEKHAQGGAADEEHASALFCMDDVWDEERTTTGAAFWGVDERTRAAMQCLFAIDVTDGLVRHAIEGTTTTNDGLIEQIKTAQSACPRIQALRTLNDAQRREHKWHAGVLWSLADGEMRLRVPENSDTALLRSSIIREMHASPLGGHFGWPKTHERLRRHFIWGNMKKETVEHCQRCNLCQRTKPAAHHINGLRTPLPVPTRVWAWVALDFVTGIPNSGPGNFDCVLIVVDRLSKRARYLPCKKDITAVQTAELYFREIFKIHGWPLRITSDRDPKFDAEVWRELWRLTGTTMSMTTANHPQADGQAEGAVKIWASLLKSFTGEGGEDWWHWLPAIEFAYNDSVVRTTGRTPFEMDNGRHPITPMAAAVGPLPQVRTTQQIQHMVRTASKRLREVLQREADSVNKGRRHFDIAVGEACYVKVPNAARENKLDNVWAGPYEVTALGTDNNTVMLKMPGQCFTKWNVEHLKKHKEGDNLEDDAIDGHKHVVETNASTSLSFRTRKMWVDGSQLLGQDKRFADVQRYVSGLTSDDNPIMDDTRVGQLVRDKIGRRNVLGRAVYFDAKKGIYHIVYENGAFDTMDISKLQAKAHVLTTERRQPPRKKDKTWDIDYVYKTRKSAGKYEWLVHWKGYDKARDSWEKTTQFDGGESNDHIVAFKSGRRASGQSARKATPPKMHSPTGTVASKQASKDARDARQKRGRAQLNAVTSQAPWPCAGSQGEK